IKENPQIAPRKPIQIQSRVAILSQPFGWSAEGTPSRRRCRSSYGNRGIKSGDGRDPDLTSLRVGDLTAGEKAQGFGVKPVLLDKDARGEVIGSIAGMDRDAGLEDGRAFIKSR